MVPFRLESETVDPPVRRVLFVAQNRHPDLHQLQVARIKRPSGERLMSVAMNYAVQLGLGTAHRCCWQPNPTEPGR